MFIVSFPYAVLQGGYWAIFAMVIIAYICCHTGKILVDCLYEVNDCGQKVRVRNSYVEIAEEVWGKRFGGRIVNIAQIIELLMTCILYLVLCGDLLIGSFPNTPLNLTSWIMISSILLLPCAFLKSLRAVSWLSFWCTVAHMFINAIILIYCFTKASEWQFSKVQIKIDIWTFPISLGIVVFSYTSQIFLPSLEGNLRDRSKFSCMMHWTHVAAAVFKAVFSYICFITWGDETKEVITNNLPSREFKAIVNLILVAKALLSYPLPYYAAVELFQTSFFKGKPFPSCFDDNLSIKVWGLTLRLGLVVITLILAIIIPHFALLMGLIGSFTGTMLSFVWPCVFHIKIKGPELRLRVKIFDIIIIFLGVICGIIGIYYSGHALLRALRGLSPEPGTKTIPIVNPPFGGSYVDSSTVGNLTDYGW
ncbi:vesicular inhibitory amino acid transporter-like [Tubulanus polymorphus]|uniref:vesicular inhibitory amino acid transporter-like n=1 Tax=Tubulanus polymorphus TaxID=672921 RepID=UPI003DA42298